MPERMEAVATSPATFRWPLECFTPALRTSRGRRHHAGAAKREKNLVGALRDGDEKAYQLVLERVSPSMLGVATSILAERWRRKWYRTPGLR